MMRLLWLSLILIFGNLTTYSVIAEECGPKLELQTIFDPSEILKKHRVNPDLVKFEFSKDEVITRFEGRPIFSIKFLKAEADRTNAFTKFLGTEADGHLKGKGLGSITYLIAAHLLFTRHGLILSNDINTLPGDWQNTLLPEAQDVWERFHKQGYAAIGTAGSTSYFHFPPEVLTGSRMVLLKSFLETRLTEK